METHAHDGAVEDLVHAEGIDAKASRALAVRPQETRASAATEWMTVGDARSAMWSFSTRSPRMMVLAGSARKKLGLDRGALTLPGLQTISKSALGPFPDILSTSTDVRSIPRSRPPAALSKHQLRANTGSALTLSPRRRARAELVHVIRPLFSLPAAVWLLRATSEAPLAGRDGVHG